jgi:hypothetical protein
MESTLYMKTIAEADYKKDSFIEKLLENPDLSPYVIAKTQKGKRLLDCNSAIHVPHETPALDEYDLAFLEQVRKCSFLTYCDKRIFRNKQFSKKTEIAKIMKYTSDKLEEPLTDINQIFHDRAKEMFRSLLKVGLFKRSRYTPK